MLFAGSLPSATRFRLTECNGRICCERNINSFRRSAVGTASGTRGRTITSRKSVPGTSLGGVQSTRLSPPFNFNRCRYETPRKKLASSPPNSYCKKSINSAASAVEICPAEWFLIRPFSIQTRLQRIAISPDSISTPILAASNEPRPSHTRSRS